MKARCQRKNRKQHLGDNRRQVCFAYQARLKILWSNWNFFPFQELRNLEGSSISWNPRPDRINVTGPRTGTQMLSSQINECMFLFHVIGEVGVQLDFFGKVTKRDWNSNGLIIFLFDPSRCCWSIQTAGWFDRNESMPNIGWSLPTMAYKALTPLKTNSLQLKTDGWNTDFLLGWPIFLKMFGLIEQKPTPWGWSLWDAKDVYISIEVRCETQPEETVAISGTLTSGFFSWKCSPKKNGRSQFLEILTRWTYNLGLGLRLVRTKRQKGFCSTS